MKACSITGCIREHRAKGLCSTHYESLRRTGRIRPLTFTEQFLTLIGRRKPHECWNWLGSLKSNGYGVIHEQRKARQAHRLCYEHFVGPIPPGLHLDHLCRNPRCVNPAHLEPVTARENTLRGIGPSAKNARKTECVHGHPLIGRNVSINDRGHRTCLTCKRVDANRRRKALAALRAMRPEMDDDGLEGNRS